MTPEIAIFLAQDGLTNGAVYALLALALVLVFTVTRVIFIPQGEFVMFGALTLASFQAGATPGTLWLLLAVGTTLFAVDAFRAARHAVRANLSAGGAFRRLGGSAALNLAGPAAVAALVLTLDLQQMPMWVQIVLTFLVVVPLGPMVYRLAFQPIADASILVLLIVAVAVHFAMVGMGLLFFGPEGARTQAFTDLMPIVAGFPVSGQALWVVGISAALTTGLYLFFGRTLFGKALRATASNRLGARLMGISPRLAGTLTFSLAAAMGVVSGILLGPITTIYYDTGFLIGLRGFVGAIIGGLASYPLAVAGAVLVGLIEAYASFVASAFKEVIVFTLIIPVLLWLSLRTHHIEDDE